DDDDVRKISLGGGTPVDLVTGVNITIPSIAVDASAVYFVTQTAIMKVGLDGGTPVELATFPQYDGLQVRVRDGFVYWLTYDSGPLMKVSTTGGTPTALASGLAHPRALALGPSTAYFAAATEIAGVGLDGGTPTTLISGEPLGTYGFVNFMAVDETG